MDRQCTRAEEGPELKLKDIGLAGTASEQSSGPSKTTSRSSGYPIIPPEGIDFEEVERGFEKLYIEEALKMAGGNDSQAARLLHMNHHTFRYRKKKVL